jgi:hypothetical protein
MTRRSIAALLVGAASLGLAACVPPSDGYPVRTAQYYSPGPQYRPDDGWERRRQWRELRRERDEARIAEAARQEAWRIEQEREQRRAWRREQRYGYAPGYYRGW